VRAKRVPSTTTTLRRLVREELARLNLEKRDYSTKEMSKALGYERVKTLAGSTYKDSSTIVIVPNRTPTFDYRIVQAWQNLMYPMNQKRAWIFCINDEVGKAYDRMVKDILSNPEFSKWKYILTLESDNLPPPDAHIRLLETIEAGKFDAVSGIYFTRGDHNMPMAYGDPNDGVFDFKPRDIRAALAQGHVMPVNGIAMGCSLYRMDLFREIEAPWFETWNDVVDGGVRAFTQDLWFCRNARARGKTFAVDLRVKVGHMDLGTGVVY
jgi:hypothetical protein